MLEEILRIMKTDDTYILKIEGVNETFESKDMRILLDVIRGRIK